MIHRGGSGVPCDAVMKAARADGWDGSMKGGRARAYRRGERCRRKEGNLISKLLMR